MAKTLRSEVADKFGGAINAGALKSLVDQVARAMEGQKTLADEIKDICAQGDEAGIASKREIPPAGARAADVARRFDGAA